MAHHNRHIRGRILLGTFAMVGVTVLCITTTKAPAALPEGVLFVRDCTVWGVDSIGQPAEQFRPEGVCVTGVLEATDGNLLVSSVDGDGGATEGNAWLHVFSGCQELERISVFHGSKAQDTSVWMRVETPVDSHHVGVRYVENGSNGRSFDTVAVVEIRSGKKVASESGLDIATMPTRYAVVLRDCMACNGRLFTGPLKQLAAVLRVPASVQPIATLRNWGAQVAVSKRHGRMAVAAWDSDGLQDHGVRLFDASGRQDRIIPLPSRDVDSLAWAGDWLLIVAGDRLMKWHPSSKGWVPLADRVKAVSSPD